MENEIGHAIFDRYHTHSQWGVLKGGVERNPAIAYRRHISYTGESGG
jgi:hypothetical protein